MLQNNFFLGIDEILLLASVRSKHTVAFFNFLCLPHQKITIQNLNE